MIDLFVFFIMLNMWEKVKVLEVLKKCGSVFLGKKMLVNDAVYGV